MPLIIPKELPAYDALYDENVFVMHRERAQSQNIRPLRILILNLMPTKIVTETQLARLLANSPLQVQITLLQTATHDTSHTSPEHMKAFYKTFDEVKHERFDGMIITGAPIEDLDYPDVDYWDELCEIMEYTKKNVYSTIHLCWGAWRDCITISVFPKCTCPRRCSACSSTGSPALPTRWYEALTRCSMPPTAAGPGWTGLPLMPAPNCAFWPRAILPGRCCCPPIPAARSL